MISRSQQQSWQIEISGAARSAAGASFSEKHTKHHMFAPSDHRPLGAHIWNKEPNGFYVEPSWCSERLFEIEKFTKSIWDPCCGVGHIAESARRAGYEIFASDLADRGYPHFGGCLDFLQCERPHGANFVFNPPFDRVEQFVRHALSFICKNEKSKVATIFLQRRLNAAHWIAELPLARVYLLTPRPSMPPGQVILAGEKPGGGTQDFCWLIFSRIHKGPPELRWLHRDGGRV
jgi:hypothetical protein